MSLKLYEFGSTRSVRIHWMLRELGAPYSELEVNLRKGEQRNPDFLKINPNGKVPVLTDGDVTIWESAAILTYLAEKFTDKKLIPDHGSKARAEYFQWMFWNQSEFEAPLWSVAKHTFIYPENLRLPAAIELAKLDFDKAAVVLDRELSDRLYILGKNFSAADILIGHTAVWAEAKQWLGTYKNIQRYIEALKKRPAFPAEKYSTI